MAGGEGPLSGLKVVDLSRLAPGPFASMLLGDLGADVVLVEAPMGAIQGMGGDEDSEEAERRRAYNSLSRNKRSVVVNLREEEGKQIVHDLAKDADVFLEGFRPGVTDRLGVGYEAISTTNPRIVYASLSGLRADGAVPDQLVGHDINYISIGGALGQIGRAGGEAGDAGEHGGGLCRRRADDGVRDPGGAAGSGADGARAVRGHGDGRRGAVPAGEPDGRDSGGRRFAGLGDGMLTGARPFYDAYECADGKFLSLGSLEPQFWAALVETLGRPDLQPVQHDMSKQDEIREFLETTLKTKSRDEWFELMRDDRYLRGAGAEPRRVAEQRADAGSEDGGRGGRPGAGVDQARGDRAEVLGHAGEGAQHSAEARSAHGRGAGLDWSGRGRGGGAAGERCCRVGNASGG